MKSILHKPLPESDTDDQFHLIEVSDAEYLEDYKLLLTFDNGVRKIVDLKNRLDGEMFEPLKNIEYFRQVKVEPDLGTICWPNEADFAPDTLYQIGKELEEDFREGMHLFYHFHNTDAVAGVRRTRTSAEI